LAQNNASLFSIFGTFLFSENSAYLVSGNILFICSRNLWRSPTAEAIYKNKQGIQAKSAGTSASAKTSVTGKIIDS
jgi:hypothetical protein